MNRSEYTRFVGKISINPESLCWIWGASRFDNGYGAFWSNGRTTQAHRWSYEFFVGAIPKEKEIDHLCRNRACVNPDHLEAVVHRVNVARGNQGLIQRNREQCPDGHPYSIANTWQDRRGHRHCRACHVVRERLRKQTIRECAAA